MSLEVSNTIDLNDYAHVKKVRQQLDILFCKNVINIIISYYVNSPCWKQTRECDVALQDVLYEVMDNNIISITRTVDQLIIGSLETTHTFAIDSPSAINMSFLAFVDNSCLYVLNSGNIFVVNYYDKHVTKLNIQTYGFADTYFYSHIFDIKNKTIYTSLLNKQIAKKTIVTDHKNKYTIRNINIHDKQLNKHSKYKQKYAVNSMYVNNHNDIAVTICMYDKKTSFFNFKFNKKTKILCMNVPSHCARILYYDGEVAMYAYLEENKNTLFCYNKINNTFCEFSVDTFSYACANKEIIFLQYDDRAIIYRSFQKN